MPSLLSILTKTPAFNRLFTVSILFFSQARCNGVIFSSVRLFLSIFFATNASTISVKPSLLAVCNGVSFLVNSFRVSQSAPCSKRNVTTGIWPFSLLPYVKQSCLFWNLSEHDFYLPLYQQGILQVQDDHFRSPSKVVLHHHCPECLCQLYYYIRAEL